MRKRMFLLVLVVIMHFSLSTYALAHPDQAQHYEDIEKVLFGKKVVFGYGMNRHSTLFHGRALNALLNIEYAVAIACDQYKGEYSAQLESLSEYGVPDLPPDVNQTKDEHERGINYIASAKTHRSFTHRGWTYDYQPSSSIANWPVRKELVYNTACVAFGEEYVDDKELDAFCALLYYTHLLGDHMEDSKMKGNGLIISLVEPGAAKRTPPENVDMFFELDYYLSVLFDDKKDDETYKTMMMKLRDLREITRKTSNSTNRFQKPEDMELYHQYVHDLHQILYTYVPRLIEREDFFNTVFYSPN